MSRCPSRQGCAATMSPLETLLWHWACLRLQRSRWLHNRMFRQNFPSLLKALRGSVRGSLLQGQTVVCEFIPHSISVCFGQTLPVPQKQKLGMGPVMWLHFSQVRIQAMHDPEQTTVIPVLWPLLDGCSAAESEEISMILKGNQTWSRCYMWL